MDVFAVILSLVLLMFLAYRGITVLVLAPLLAMLAALLTGEIPALSAWTGYFMPAAAGYLQKYFPVFLAGAIFGKLMGSSGAARSIAHFIADKAGKKRAIAAVITATGLLVYGGVSLFVVVFAVYPIGAMLFREGNVPKRLLPAAIAAGAFTFAMTAMPGTPQYINTMPIPYFGTDIYAAPILGLVGSLVMFFGSITWLNLRAAKMNTAGEGYGDHPNENLNLEGEVPSFGMAITPVLVVFVINFFLTNFYFKSPSVVAQYEAFGGVNGIWSVVIALSVAIVLCLFMFKKNILRIQTKTCSTVLLVHFYLFFLTQLLK